MYASVLAIPWSSVILVSVRASVFQLSDVLIRFEKVCLLLIFVVMVFYR